MAIPDLCNVKWRGYAAFGAIVGGTALACSTGGLSAAVGLGLASIFGNVAAGDAARKWDERRRGPKYAHPNHDLAKLVGQAIARVFYQCAEVPEHKAHAKWLNSLGNCAEAGYLAIAEHVDFDALASRKLPQLFEAAAAENGSIRLDEINWPGLVEFLRGKAKQKPNQPAATLAAERLGSGLFANVREMFKRDFSGEGRAYAALCIDMNGMILARLGDVARDQREALTRLNMQVDDLQAIKALLEKNQTVHRSALTEDQSRGLNELLDEFPMFGRTLDHALLTVWKIDRRTERMEARQITDSARLEKIEQAIQDFLADKKPGEDPSRQPVPPELIEQAKLLCKRGNDEQKALAEIALRRHEAADAIIQRLKRDPLAETHRLLTLEGDNWYQAGEFDRAIEPYDAALALRPKDLVTRNNAMIAHNQARLGDIAAHRRRAIQIGQESLKTLPAGSQDWAMTQNNLGIAWSDMPTGDRGENLRQAIAAYEAALTVRTREAHPVAWAMTQNNLGAAWRNMPTGDRSENLRQAIDAYEAALTVYTREAHPVAWAMTQNNLGIAWKNLPTGDRAENLRQAIDAYEAALTVRTREAHPVDWAMTQNNLGNAWQSMPTGDRGENLRQAIDAYEAALTVYTREAHPVDWAATQNNLGNAWQSMPTGDRGENLRKAIAAYEAALTVRTREAHPVDWAMTQNNLGAAWQSMPTGDRGGNLRQAIAAYEAALTVRTREAHPVDWAMTRFNLAIAIAALAELPGQDRCGLLRRAIACGQAALMVYTNSAHPREHAGTLHNYEIVCRAYEAAGCHRPVPIKDIPPAE